MQALILAAGMGRRLGELTKGHTKCMVEVNGVTLLDHDVMISNCGRKKKMSDRNLIRLAVRSRSDNDRLIAILKSI